MPFPQAPIPQQQPQRLPYPGFPGPPPPPVFPHGPAPGAFGGVTFGPPTPAEFQIDIFVPNATVNAANGPVSHIPQAVINNHNNLAAMGGLNVDLANRPPSLEIEDMRVDLACSICYSYVADVMFLPCRHLICCNWCAVAINANVPGAARCPVCRTQVESAVRAYRA